MQVFDREREVFGESAVVIHDAEDGAARAVRFQSAETEFAERFMSVGGAGDVDFAGDALTGPAGLFALDRRGWFTTIADGDDVADEFVAGDAAEVVVAAEDFDVRVADAGEADFDQGPVGGQFGKRLFDWDKLTVGDLEGFHVCAFSSDFYFSRVGI